MIWLAHWRFRTGAANEWTNILTINDQLMYVIVCEWKWVFIGAKPNDWMLSNNVWIKRTNDISKICVLMSWAFSQNGKKNVTHTNENEIHMKYKKKQNKRSENSWIDINKSRLWMQNSIVINQCVIKLSNKNEYLKA